MAADNFIYQGINRAVSDYAGTRACEELINLRPTEGGVVPVRDFTTKMADKPFFKVFVHYTTSGPKYIAIWKDGSTVKASPVNEDGSFILDSQQNPIVLFSTPYIDEATVDSIYYASAGNVLVFSMCDRVHTPNVYKNAAWIWKGGEYQRTEADIPPVSYSINDGTNIVSATQSIPAISGDSDGPEIISAIENGINAVLENNQRLCIGPILIATAYKTKDGKTFWTNNWKIYDPLEKIGTTTPPYETLTTLNEIDTRPLYVDFFDKYDGHGFAVAANRYEGSTGLYGTYEKIDLIELFGTNVTLNFPRVSGWDEDTSIIQSVEVYCSKPIPYLDTASAVDGFKSWMSSNPGNSSPYVNLLLAQKKYEDMDLGGQLLYLQASIPMASLAKESQPVNLTFGGNSQVTEDSLDTDAGAIQRFGRVLSYNARFHFFDSVAKIEIGKPYLYTTPTGNTGAVHLLVRYSDSNTTSLLYVGDTDSSFDYGQPANFVISSQINVKEVITYFRFGNLYYAYIYRMTPSTAYNYAYGSISSSTTKTSSSTMTEYENAISENSKTVTSFEPDAINVSEQYNPFVFLVEHSYKAPGNIIDVVPQMAGVVDANYGRDPLNVFTERGTYALTQGSANVLYGAFLPLSNLKAARGALSLESGIYFLADGGLWLVSGRQVVLVSEALNLGPHKYIRSCTGYMKLSGDETEGTEIVPYYDASPYLSKVEFKEFVTGGQLGYNRFRMEIFVSNKLYDYTYVLSLKYRQWFKMSKRLWQDEPRSIIINKLGAVLGTISVLDMSDEVTDGGYPLLVHLQSRPFSMGYQYSHIHRIVSMVRAKLSTSDHKIAVGLYGSDDLQRWKLLAYAKRNGTKWDATQEEYADADVFLAQVRTTSSARSWRYYTICIGGEIPVDVDFPTDFGPVIVDYDPVVRRIG